MSILVIHHNALYRLQLMSMLVIHHNALYQFAVRLEHEVDIHGFGVAIFEWSQVESKDKSCLILN